MTAEQQRKMLEAAAKACGAHAIIGATDDGVFTQWSPILRGARLWNPLTNPADCAEMCARSDIDTSFYRTLPRVECSVCCSNDIPVISETISHDGTPEDRLKAWMYAATMVAAKIGGYEA